jgi:hypothetical protein
VLKMVVLLLCAFGFYWLVGCHKSSEEAPTKMIWDIKKTVSSHVLNYGVHGPKVVHPSRTVGAKLSTDAEPIFGGNEGCMCVYLEEPSNVADSVAKLFLTEALFEPLSKSSEPGAAPTILVNFGNQTSYGTINISVISNKNEVCSLSAKFDHRLIYNPSDFDRNRPEATKEVGYLGLNFQWIKQALHSEPRPADSPVFKVIDDFLHECSF